MMIIKKNLSISQTQFQPYLQYRLYSTSASSENKLSPNLQKAFLALQLKKFDDAELFIAFSIQDFKQKKKFLKYTSCFEILGDIYASKNIKPHESMEQNLIKAIGVYNHILAVHEKKIEIGYHKLTYIKEKINHTEVKFLKYFCKQKYAQKLTTTEKETLQNKNHLKSLRSSLDFFLQKLGKKDLFQLKTADNEAEYRFLSNYIARSIRALLQKILTRCEFILGKPPCEYSIMSLGSLARREITAYSDLEFAIIIEDKGLKDNTFNKQYFRNLTNLMHIKILNLGETIIPRLGITSLSDFYDDISTNGFSFDGSLGNAYKTPLGNTNSSSEIFSFELIHTPESMVELITSIPFNHWKYEKNITTTLITNDWVYGKIELIDKFNHLVRLKLNKSSEKESSIAQKKAIYLLENEILSYKKLKSLNRHDIYLDIKREYYTPFLAIFERLGLFFSLSSKSTYDKIQELFKKEIISLDMMKNFQLFWSTLLLWRHQLSIFHGSQNYRVLIKDENSQIYSKPLVCETPDYQKIFSSYIYQQKTIVFIKKTVDEMNKILEDLYNR